MTKTDLLGIFRACHNQCIIVYAATVLFGDEDIPKYFTTLDAILNIPKRYPDNEILPLLYDRTALKHSFIELNDTVHRTALTTLYEKTRSYCEKTGQTSILHKQPWYRFWRILRNCFSHDFIFLFSEFDKKKLPITWGNLTLDLSREGTQLTHGEFPREKIWDLLNEVKLFIEKDLA
jgi:hypothetical protein